MSPARIHDGTGLLSLLSGGVLTAMTQNASHPGGLCKRSFFRSRVAELVFPGNDGGELVC